MDAPCLHDPARDVWLLPIRHHSPACAAHLARMIDEIAPAAILVEGPCDFDPLIDLVCDPRTRAPVAIVAMRAANQADGSGGAQRAVSYFPFCAHSPELIALHAAKARGAAARFIDLPSTAREMVFDADGLVDRSLLGDERPFDVSDYVTALARELGCRDGAEVWDHLFETRLVDPDWRGFFADVGRYCVCIRAASDPVEQERDGTLAREAQMRALIARARAEFTGPIVVVTGGFHSPALFAAQAGDAPAAPAGKADAAHAYLIRYGMRQLDVLSGYGAGLPLPGFYDRLWRAAAQGQDGRGFVMEIVSGFAAHLRAVGREPPPFPAIVNAAEQAERLAALRGRAVPMRDDVIDAIRSTFIKEEIPTGDAPLLIDLRNWLTGSAIGDTPPSAGSPPLVEAVRGRARALGFSVADGDRRNRELDIYRKPRHRAASRFCHALVLIGAPFGQRTAGPDFRNDAGLDRLHEVWSVGWSPAVETRLIELSAAADTLEEALAYVLAESLAALASAGQGRNAAAAIDLYAAACRAGLGHGASAALRLVDDAVAEDPELASVVAAFGDLLRLRRAGETLGGIDGPAIDRIAASAWRRILLLLPDLAEGGADQLGAAVAALADLRGAVELARACAAPIDLAAFDAALLELGECRLEPMLAGAVAAFALIDGRADAPGLAARLRGELRGGYVLAAERLAFLSGIIAIARELLWTVPELIEELSAVMAGVDDAEFLALLPHLRLALMALDPREIDRLGETVAAALGARPDQVSAHVLASESEMIVNLALDRDLARILARDGILPEAAR